MRYVFSFLGAFALSLALMAGCSDENGEGGSGGTAGTGGSAGSGGSGGMAEEAGCAHGFLCYDIDCDDGDPCTEGECSWADGTCSYRAACDDFNDCTTEMCNPADGACSTPSPVADGTACEGGTCQSGVCELTGSVLPCTVQGIRNAIAAGSGSYTFDCSGPTTLSPEGGDGPNQQFYFVVEKDVILDGQGNLTLNGSCRRGLVSVSEGATVELRGFVLTEGAADPGGAGIANEGTLTLVDTTVSRCTALGGGDLNPVGDGIANGGTLTLTNSTVSENGPWAESIDSGGTLTITNSTISGNSGGIKSGSLVAILDSTVSDNGSGILLDGEASSLVLANSTVSGNGESAIESGSGTLILTSSTISGDIGIRFGGTLTLTGSVIDGVCDAEDGVTFISGGYNIESDEIFGDTCDLSQPTDLVDVTPGQLALQPLADNGGPTMTHALGAGSVAIDQIPEADCVDADGQPLTTDQRGLPRPETGGSMCDVGAFEVQP